VGRRLVIVLALLTAVVVGGYAGYRYMFDSPPQAYATYTPPPKAGLTDQQRIFELQNDLGNAAAEMAQLQEMARKLQFGKMKAMGAHLQEVADQLEPRLDDIEDEQARAVLAEGIEGLRTVGEGSAELDQDKSLRGVDDVLGSFEAMRELQRS
jgi:uncharacterized membrane protein